MGKTIELRLKISEEELIELSESIEKSVSELSDELDETLEEGQDTSDIANKMLAAQSLKCKISMQSSPVQPQRVGLPAAR